MFSKKIFVNIFTDNWYTNSNWLLYTTGDVVFLFKFSLSTLNRKMHFGMWLQSILITKLFYFSKIMLES